MPQLSLKRLTKSFHRSGVVVDSIDLEIEEGEFFTLLGPSGCGKSTTLRMIAGFEDPTSGSVHFSDKDVTWLPPNRREVGVVFQNYALFPHLTVAKNVAFGLEAHHVKRAESARRVAEALAMVQLSDQAKARVDELSGGQQQRVALARAIVLRPQLLLLDEPLSNLDAKLRDETRAALRHIHAETGLTSIYVTHDQAEALAMSSRIAVMAAGRIEQVGTPREVYERPATRFVAAFLGRNNIYPATVTTRTGEDVGMTIAGVPLRGLTQRVAPGTTLTVGDKVTACLRAEQVRLADAPGPNTIAGTVTDVEYEGAALSCAVETAMGALNCDLDGHLRVPVRGEQMHVLLPPEAWYFLPGVDPASGSGKTMSAGTGR
jgi:iron(III) transport system ATP-binding protein